MMKNGRLTFGKAARAQAARTQAAAVQEAPAQAALSPLSPSSASSGLQPPDLPVAKEPSIDSVRADE
jgi:hypothetical protein